MGLEAGASVVDITPRTPCHLAGYAARDHGHEEVHDPLSLRALYVRGSGGDGLLVSADVLWICENTIERVLPVLERELSIPPCNVLLCGTHTHSAPAVRRDDVNVEWRSLLEKQVVAAAAIAKTRLTDVVMKVGRGTSDIAMNRREMKPDGSITLGLDPDGPRDRELIVAVLEGGDGAPVARVANFSCHGTMMSQKNYAVSGDWMGVAAARIEEAEGAPFLFLNSGAGNVCPRVDRQEAFEPVAELADEFVADVRKACEDLQEMSRDTAVGGAEQTVHLPRKLRDVEEGMGKLRKVRLQGLGAGPLRLLGYPGEAFSETTMAVKAGSPHAVTMVCSYAAGCSAGYAPVDAAYETGGYEVRVTPYAEGAEGILRRGLLDLAEALP